MTWIRLLECFCWWYCNHKKMGVFNSNNKGMRRSYQRKQHADIAALSSSLHFTQTGTHILYVYNYTRIICCHFLLILFIQVQSIYHKTARHLTIRPQYNYTTHMNQASTIKKRATQQSEQSQPQSMKPQNHFGHSRIIHCEHATPLLLRSHSHHHHRHRQYCPHQGNSCQWRPSPPA